MPEKQADSAKEKAAEAESAASGDGVSGFRRRIALPVVAGAAVAAITIAVRRGGDRVKEAVANADVDELPDRASRALDVAKDRLGDLAGKVPPVADNVRERLPVAGDANAPEKTFDGAGPVYRNAEERVAAQKDRAARRAERRKRSRS